MIAKRAWMWGAAALLLALPALAQEAPGPDGFPTVAALEAASLPPRDRVDLAIGEDHARDRTVPKFSGLWVKLRRCGQLLAQVGRGIDQEPVLAVGADRDRSLRARKLRMFATCHPADRTSAIPLRNAAACRRAQDDDAKHDPSPGIPKL